MAEHYMVVHPDDFYLKRLEERTDIEITDEIRAEAWTWRIECSDPSQCHGWQECAKDHGGLDPEDEDSPAYDQHEDVMIHGEPHSWQWSYGWCVEFTGCIVIEMAAWHGERPEGEHDHNRPGRYLLDVDWEDDSVYLTIKSEVKP